MTVMLALLAYPSQPGNFSRVFLRGIYAYFSAEKIRSAAPVQLFGRFVLIGQRSFIWTGVTPMLPWTMIRLCGLGKPPKTPSLEFLAHDFFCCAGATMRAQKNRKIE